MWWVVFPAKREGQPAHLGLRQKVPPPSWCRCTGAIGVPLPHGRPRVKLPSMPSTSPFYRTVFEDVTILWAMGCDVAACCTYQEFGAVIEHVAFAAKEVGASAQDAVLEIEAAAAIAGGRCPDIRRGTVLQMVLLLLSSRAAPLPVLSARPFLMVRSWMVSVALPRLMVSHSPSPRWRSRCHTGWLRAGGHGVHDGSLFIYSPMMDIRRVQSRYRVGINTLSLPVMVEVASAGMV